MKPYSTAAEATIKRYRKQWGDFAPTREHVFTRTLLYNGFEWRDGALVDTYEARSRRRAKQGSAALATMEAQFRATLAKMAPEARAGIRRNIRNNEAKRKRALLHNVGWKLYWYAGSSDTPICCVPDDVKPDWLAVVRECLFAMLRACGNGKLELFFFAIEGASPVELRGAPHPNAQFDRTFDPAITVPVVEHLIARMIAVEMRQHSRDWPRHWYTTKELLAGADGFGDCEPTPEQAMEILARVSAAIPSAFDLVTPAVDAYAGGHIFVRDAAGNDLSNTLRVKKES